MTALPSTGSVPPATRPWLLPIVAAVGAVTAVLLTVAAASGGGALDVPTAVVLGVVEGLTEFLPVSSTGHLTVVERLFDISGDAADAYAIVIQAGAILAVVVLYRARLLTMVEGLVGRSATGRTLLVGVVVAFVPATVIGFVLGDTIKSHLFSVGPVAAAWAVGGLVILWAGDRIHRAGLPLESLTPQTAAIIGLAQAAALWPGVSRSLVTILVALAVGLSLPAAVEFSFLLGFVTLGAATAYEALDKGGQIVDAYGVLAPVVGFVVAFVAAVVAVRWMVAYLERGSLLVFGWYRLAIAAVAAALLLTNVV